MTVLKLKTRQERLKKLPGKAIALILERSTGIFEREKVTKIIVDTCAQVDKPLRTKQEVDSFAAEIHKFLNKFKFVYNYVVAYRYNEPLTLELIDKLYSLHLEKRIWLVLDREHNVGLVETEIASLLSD